MVTKVAPLPDIAIPPTAAVIMCHVIVDHVTHPSCTYLAISDVVFHRSGKCSSVMADLVPCQQPYNNNAQVNGHAVSLFYFSVFCLQIWASSDILAQLLQVISCGDEIMHGSAGLQATMTTECIMMTLHTCWQSCYGDGSIIFTNCKSSVQRQFPYIVYNDYISPDCSVDMYLVNGSTNKVTVIFIQHLVMVYCSVCKHSSNYCSLSLTESNKYLPYSYFVDYLSSYFIVKTP